MIVRVKAGVAFTRIAPAGFRILGALERIAVHEGVDLTITSACDGEHSGPGDPHHRGEAYDVRTHDLGPAVARVLFTLTADLGIGFYAVIEGQDTPNEHLHVQVRKGAGYP